MKFVNALSIIFAGLILMAGAASASVQCTTTTILASGVSPPLSSVTAGYNLINDGNILKSINGNNTDIGDWVTPQSGESNWEVKFTQTSGTCMGGPYASWLNLGSLRSFWLTAGIGTHSCVTQVQIRDVATQTVQATCSITLTDFLTH